MPKTHTDDVAPALPSSIDGPFTIVDASDAASFIKIDPATASLAATGTARPTRLITLAFVRIYLFPTSDFIGVMAARTVGANSVGGFYPAPTRIPEDMDVTQPSTVSVLVATAANQVGPAEVVRFSLWHTIVKDLGPATTGSITFDWTAPANWQTDDHRLVAIDNGNGRTFDPNTFALGDLVGFRLSRAGSDAADTFSQSVKLAEFIQFEYTAGQY